MSRSWSLGAVFILLFQSQTDRVQDVHHVLTFDAVESVFLSALNAFSQSIISPTVVNNNIQR